jgi:uncharacterized protein YggT (Ycf19 family)
MESPERRLIREGPEAGREPIYASADPVVAREPMLTTATYNYRAERVVWFITGLIVALVAIRFVMKLLGASLASAFTGFLYGLTEPLVAPFRGIFPAGGQSGYVFEPSSLVAIVIYALIGWGIVALIRIMSAPRMRKPVA